MTNLAVQVDEAYLWSLAASWLDERLHPSPSLPAPATPAE